MRCVTKVGLYTCFAVAVLHRLITGITSCDFSGPLEEDHLAWLYSIQATEHVCQCGSLSGR